MENLPELNLTEEVSQTIGEKFIVFTLGDELFAVSAEKVTEVVQPLEITPLPNVAEWLSGITNIRGEIVSVINLPKLWNKNNQSDFAKPKLIILREQNNLIAVATDKLNEIVKLTEETITLCQTDSHIYAKAVFNSKNLQIINTENLFSNLSEKTNL